MKTKIIFFFLFTLLFYIRCNAQDYFKVDSLKNTLENVKADTNRVFTLNNLSKAYWSNFPDTGLLYARQAMDLAKKLGFKKGICRAYLNIGICLRNKGSYEVAIQFMDSALRIATSINHLSLSGDCYISIGTAYWCQSNYPKALDHFFKTLEIRETVHDTMGIGLAYGNIGLIYWQQGNYPQALNYQFKALKIVQAKNEKMGIGKINSNIGLIYYDEGNLPQSLEHHLKSLKIREAINDKRGMSECYNNIGLIYMKQRKYPLALDNYFASLKIAEITDDKFTMGICYDNIGTIYTEEGNYEDALKNHFASLKIVQEIGDTLGISGCYSNIGMVYNKKGQYSEAIQYLHKGLLLAKGIGTKEAVKDNYERLSEVYEKNNDYKNAIQFHKLFSQMKDTLLNETNSKQINEMKEQYESEKKEKEIVVLTKDKEIQNVEIKKQKLLKYSLMIGLGLVLILVFIGYRAYQTRQLLKLQTLRNKIASDLHDDVGSTLSSISIFSEMVKEQSSEVNPMLEQIGDSSRKMLDAMADIVWTINPENDQFEKIILRMKSFAYELLGAKKIDFEFEADENVSQLKLPMDVRKNLYLIFKEATNNMVKYSAANKASFSISGNKEMLTMFIRDNGKGFDVNKDSQGNGLKNMKKRAKEIGANLLIESEAGMGTILQLILNLA